MSQSDSSTDTPSDFSTERREGLPASYRMRADAHYVDTLMSRPLAGRDEAKATAVAVNVRATPQVPDLGVAPPAADAGHQAGALLEHSLATLMACSTALASVTSTLSRAGVTELIRAEAWRASSLALAARLMRRELPVTRMSVSVARLVDGIVDAFGPELRVRGVEIDADVTPRGLHAPVDSQMVSAILTHGLFLTLAILDGSTGARVHLSAALAEGDELTLAVSQASAGVPQAWASRAFDEAWSQRPGGELALVSALAVRSATELLNGRCQLSGTDRSTRILVAIPDSKP